MMSAVFAAHREHHGPTEGLDELWSQLGELGLVRLTGSETSGGSGAGWAEGAELLRAAAWHAASVPVAEHDLLACWLLEAAELEVGAARRTAALLDESGTARAVPWVVTSERIVVIWPDGTAFRVADVDVASVRLTAGRNGAGEPRDTVVVDTGALTGTPVAATLVAQWRRRAALIRAIQVCAALDRILALTVTHARERIQFGRPLAKFQAVQHLVADIAAEAALARAATDAALAEAIRTDWTSEQLDFLVAVARSCAGHAATVVVRNAHQVHGAIGTTREHRLHEFTARALAWRSEYGSVQSWDDALTDHAIAAGTNGLWALITGTDSRT
ncbi:acyl-CoA dehydrogenase [Mycobacterium aquaticum]|uniref:Acyl-CoA dehydrogenase n=2 Tax=Mycobacterium aquaticum TaxID=1927124 RepID=A0A1X0ANM8_9MYCO|nr:acyl-CoA dehydrogenase family protein [Mycobacterium aquaticum]ORA31649.1 acyl-CoA dehydrogenase [Mycobacterium aquaticum]